MEIGESALVVKNFLYEKKRVIAYHSLCLYNLTVISHLLKKMRQG